MAIFLTIVLAKIEALGTREEAGPDFGIECVRDGLGPLVLAVFPHGRELKEVPTSNYLTSVSSHAVIYL